MTDLELQEKFIEHCVTEGLVPVHKMAQARIIAESAGRQIYEVLEDIHLLSQNQLNQALSETTGVPPLDPFLESYKTLFSEETLCMISHKLAISKLVFPLWVKDGALHVVMANPTDTATIDAISKMSGFPVEAHVCYFKNVIRAVVRYYSYISGKRFEVIVKDAIDEITGKKTIIAPPSIWVEPLSEALFREVKLFPGNIEPPKEGEVAINQLVQKIIDNAIYIGASDIHIEPFADVVKVRLRRDGILDSQWYVPNEIKSYLYNRIKVMANLDLTSSNKPQDGHIPYENILPVGVDIRVATVPTEHGERIVLRLLDKNRTLLHPEAIGMEPEDQRLYQKQIQAPQGLVLLTGPTGSGKTTTIYVGLDQLNTDERCIITIEDPVEYELSGVSQVQIDPRQNFGFSNALRAILRQNPDVVLLGEIRDPESAQVAVSASSTGHLVFSTLHTNSAADAVTRLISMDADPFVLSSSLQMIVGQRLVRRLCNKCKQPIIPSQEQAVMLGLVQEGLSDETFHGPVGCDACFGHGYLGRIGVFELLAVDDAVRNMIVSQAPSIRIQQYAVENGMRTMRQDALRKAARGITSLDEVIKRTAL
jgi:type II secretory ATPase GspE/PulE/Tfp pilus assembly ATPase PilB-like protein